MRQRGSDYPFRALAPRLRSADIAFGNLECSLSTRGQPVANKRYRFRGRPANALALRNAGFDIVSLANNHTLDFGREGLADTLRHVRAAGVRTVGAGPTPEEAPALEVLSVRGLRVGFLAFLGMFPPILQPVRGAPHVAMAYPSTVRDTVREAAKRCDVLVVSLHAGREYSFRRSARQQQIARAAVDAGAHLVIGHHPHVVQDTEVYRGTPIVYSLGNFVFDPSPRFLRDGGRRWSAMLEADLEQGRVRRWRLVGLRIVDRQPRLAAGARKGQKAEGAAPAARGSPRPAHLRR